MKANAATTPKDLQAAIYYVFLGLDTFKDPPIMVNNFDQFLTSLPLLAFSIIYNKKEAQL